MQKKKYTIALIALLISTVMFALGSTLVKLMLTKGGQFGLQYPGALSFCNVLFVGNICVALIIGLIYGTKNILIELWHLPIMTKLSVILASLLFASSISFVFIGLEYTSVVNVVIITRFTTIFYILFSFLMLGTRIRWQESAGYGFIAISIFVMLIIKNNGIIFIKGDWLVLIGSFLSSFIRIVSKKSLQHCSNQAFAFANNLFSASIFFVIVLIFFRPEHFMDVFKGELWILMVLYAGVALVLPIILNLFSLKNLSSTTIANTTMFSPIISLIFAYLLLQEVPNELQIIILLIIAMSLGLPKIMLTFKR